MLHILTETSSLHSPTTCEAFQNIDTDECRADE